VKNEDQRLKQGIEAFNSGEYEKSQEILGPLAEGGNEQAQTWLGFQYLNGLWVEKDPVAARNLFLEAAAKGVDTAASNLGTIYEFGWGVEVDFAEAARWYRMAVDGGDPAAMNNLANLLIEGRGVEQDVEEAMRLLEQSAIAGHPAAWASLGSVYYSGLGGVPIEKKRAKECYEQSWELGGPTDPATLDWSDVE